MARRPESVLVVIYTRDGQVLLLQRADDPSFWQSVTGSLEAEEQPHDAAVRELQEETGLRCDNLFDCQRQNRYAIRQDWLARYPVGTTHNTEHVFLAEFNAVPEVIICADEHLDFTWVSAAEAVARLWSSSNRQAVTEFVLPRLGQA